MTKGVKGLGVQGVGGREFRGFGVEGVESSGGRALRVKWVGRRETATDVEPMITEN